MYATRIRIVLTTSKADIHIGDPPKRVEVVKEHEHGITACGLRFALDEAIKVAGGDHVYVERIDCEVSPYLPLQKVRDEVS
jgi:hypothetical protein